MGRIVKVPYYLRSTVTLARALEKGSHLPALTRRRPLAFRKGLELEVAQLLDLLIVKETVCDDAYRLADLGTSDPRLIVDVGAGIGDFAALAAFAFPNAEVLAVEPNPASFAVLERNIRRNHLTNVDARCIAVGTRSFYKLGDARWSATAATADGGRSIRTVPALPLRGLIGKRDVDLLKIDCEGAELDVLNSLGSDLGRVRRTVVEYHDHLAEEAGDRVEQRLRAEGFAVRRQPDRYDRRIGYVRAFRP